MSFKCSQCGKVYNDWMPGCVCGAFGTVIEESSSAKLRAVISNEPPCPITRVKNIDKERFITSIPEFNRLMGGGIVKGSVILVSGAPGIGKSTLLMQVSGSLCSNKCRVLYITAEESVYQTKIRAERLGINYENLLLVAENNIDIINKYITENKPNVIIIDSIQMAYKPDINSSPGGVTQMRECAMDLIYTAKRENMSLFMVGHITKDGNIAGPMLLEHMVDTVVYFEGDSIEAVRTLRIKKNRFGPANETAFFNMGAKGLAEIKEHSYYSHGSYPGKTITAVIKGSRAYISEIQALVSPSNLDAPLRRKNGIDYDRFLMILSILENNGHDFSSHDVYVNAPGGMDVTEPAADLAIATAIVSSIEKRAIDEDIIIGELGLTGEIRPVPEMGTRLNEAVRMGITKAYIPVNNFRDKKLGGMEIVNVSDIEMAMETIMPEG